MFGIVLSILSLAKLLDYSLVNILNILGLIFLACINSFYVGQKIKFWNWKIMTTLILGALIAFIISFISPSPSENTSYFYIFICGLIGVCGMILRFIWFLYFNADGKLSSVNGKIN